jgi:hypothetical protein
MTTIHIPNGTEPCEHKQQFIRNGESSKYGA